MEFQFSAGAIIYTYIDGIRHYLVLQREDWLDMPKGHIEKGEDPRSAAVRETREETGLDVSLDPYFKEKIAYWYFERKQKVKKTVTFYLSKTDVVDVNVSFEHIGYMWITLQNRPKLYKNMENLLKRADEYIDRLEEIKIINREYSELPGELKKWELSRNFVPGDGPVNAKVMVIGQAPGRFEDKQRKPFIGMAGKLLTLLLKKAGFERSEVYITSVVQFFPPDNRLPTDEEALCCLPFLKKQIEIIRPRLIVLLGNFATLNVDGSAAVMKNHGKLIKSREYGGYIFISLHPAAAVRMKKFVPLMEKDFANLKKLVKKGKLLD